MKQFVSLMRTPFAILFQTDYTNTVSPQTNKLSNILSFLQSGFKKANKFFKNSRYLPFVIVIGVITIITVFVINGVLAKTQVNGTQDKRIAINKPIASQTLNKQFSFPLKDDKDREVSKFSYTIENVELRNEIIVKGQKATSIKGRAFLIFNIKITNTFNKNIQVQSKDYLRLTVNGTDEKLAADIHNDPVEVQAISTKYTRLGLAINETDKDIVLQVGEINGKKQTIKLDLK